MVRDVSPMDINFPKGLPKQPMIPPHTSYLGNSGAGEMRERVRDTAKRTQLEAASPDRHDAWYDDERNRMEAMLAVRAAPASIPVLICGGAMENMFKKGTSKEPMIHPHQAYTGASGDLEVRARVYKALRDAQCTLPGHRDRVILERLQEKNAAMHEAEREYRQRVANILAKRQSESRVTAGLNHDALIQEKKKVALKDISKKDAEYRGWLRQHMQVQDDRISDTLKARQIAKDGYEQRRRVEDEHREARVQEMNEQDRRWQAHLSSISGSKSVSPKKRNRPLILNKAESLPAIWERSLEERAQVEKEYWRYSKGLKAKAVCAVDHKLIPSPKAESNIQKALQDSLKNERRYRQWAKSIKGQKKCGIDQGWAALLDAAGD